MRGSMPEFDAATPSFSLSVPWLGELRGHDAGLECEVGGKEDWEVRHKNSFMRDEGVLSTLFTPESVRVQEQQDMVCYSLSSKVGAGEPVDASQARRDVSQLVVAVWRTHAFRARAVDGVLG
ncbi:hypothetical protein B0H13DRAFT_1892831 [Mycena leptocephala]|nr:hypothetical protein B0H13DRAFT_1892831 [Mycena leptocephala]